MLAIVGGAKDDAATDPAARLSQSGLRGVDGRWFGVSGEHEPGCGAVWHCGSIDGEPEAFATEKMTCRHGRSCILVAGPPLEKTPASMKYLILPALLFLTATMTAAPRQKIDVSSLPSQSRIVGDVIVPVPSEIFGVLDKLGKPRWVEVLRPMKSVAKPFGDQPQVALYLGTIIAEGFVAVEAEDGDQVQKIGRSVLSLSEALGVSKSVKKRANAIIDAGDRKDWKLVRKELDGALSEVKESMAELGSEQLSQLVSLGGWIRGTEALCEVVSRDYSRDGADLLHQPVLVDYFAGQLEGLKGRYKRIPLIGKLQTGLHDIRPLLGLTDGAEISAKSVREVGNISAGLVKAVQTR
jgi:hypothetical protein